MAFGIEDGYRVAISNAPYATGQSDGVCGTGQQYRQDNQGAENGQRRPRVSGIHRLLAIV